MPRWGFPSGKDRPLLLFCGYSLVGTLAVVGLLAFFPLHQELDYRVGRLSSPPPEFLRLELERADLSIRFRDGHPGPPSLRGTMRGLVLPNHRIRAAGWIVPGDAPLLVYRVEQRGYFTRLDARMTLELDPTRWKRLEVRLGEGDIKVEQSGSGPLPSLDLETGKGSVLSPFSNETPGGLAAR